MHPLAAGFGAEGEGQVRVRLHTSQLAANGTEPEGIQEAAAADLTGVGDALSRPRLWPLVEEDDFGAVDDVSLDVRNVYKFRHLRHPDHIVIR